MSRIFSQSTGWIVDRPVFTYLFIAVISGIAILGYINPEIVRDFFSEENPVEQSRSVNEFEGVTVPEAGFSLDSHAVIVAESDDFFTSDGVRTLRNVVSELESHDYISRVIWMDQIPMLNIFGLPEPLLPHAEASPERMNAARQKALDHPFIHGQLMSSDGKVVLLLVNFDVLFIKDDDDTIGGLRKIADAAAKAANPEGNFDVKFSVTGSMPIYVTARKSHEANQFFYQLVGYSMIALMSVILFRGIAAVFVVALAPAMGVFWTMGFIQFFGYGENPFNDVVLPVLVSLVGLTDGVHLMVQIRKLRSSGEQPRDAARLGIRQVGLACALTSLTTAIGFGSLALANHIYVQQFGMCCVIGVVLSFISVVTTIPLACSTWLGNFVQVGQSKSLVDQNLERITGVIDYVLPRKRLFSWLGIGLTIAFILISLTLRPDERRSSILPQSSEASVTLKRMDSAMGGLETCSVNLNWSKNVDSSSPDIMRVIGKVDAILKDEPLVGFPLSIRNLINSLPGEGKPEDRMSMLELLPPSFKRAFYTPEYRTAKVVFRVQDLGISTYNPVFERIETGLAELEKEYGEFEFAMRGEAVGRWNNLFQIVIDLAASLGTASLIIFVVLALVYRSLRIGLISFIPNLFPLAVSGCYLVFSGQSLEIVTVCAFTVCLGIAVDDTIHFLTRYQEEKEKTDDDAEAIRNAFAGVGTALIMTTIVLVSGFGTVLFSDSRDHFIFASMGMITLSAALFADLVFLPALLAQYMKPHSDNGLPTQTRTG
ncbi:MAG: RND family transporter [Mariniblastus sp.]